MQASTPSTDPDMIESCKSLMEEYDRFLPGVGQAALVNVGSKPTFIIGSRELGVALLAQYGQLKQLEATEEQWTGVDLKTGTLKESLIKLAREKGIADSLRSDNVNTNLIFQFVKAQGNTGLNDHVLDIDKLENTSGRQCTIVAGEPRRDLAGAAYPPMDEFVIQHQYLVG